MRKRTEAEGYEASDEMLYAHMKKYGLEDQDWRRGYWDKPKGD